MIKNKTVLSVKVEDRLYELLCESTSTLGELHDVLSAMKKFVVDEIVKRQTAEVKSDQPSNSCTA